MAVLRATESRGTEPPGATDHLYSFLSAIVVVGDGVCKNRQVESHACFVKVREFRVVVVIKVELR